MVITFVIMTLNIFFVILPIFQRNRQLFRYFLTLGDTCHVIRSSTCRMISAVNGKINGVVKKWVKLTKKKMEH